VAQESKSKMHFVEVLTEQRRESGGVGYTTEYVLVTGADPGIREDIVGNPKFKAQYDQGTDRIRCGGRSHMDVSCRF
jgi:hypothetical protein